MERRHTEIIPYMYRYPSTTLKQGMNDFDFDLFLNVWYWLNSTDLLLIEIERKNKVRKLRESRELAMDKMEWRISKLDEIIDTARGITAILTGFTLYSIMKWIKALYIFLFLFLICKTFQFYFYKVFFKWKIICWVWKAGEHLFLL